MQWMLEMLICQYQAENKAGFVHMHIRGLRRTHASRRQADCVGKHTCMMLAPKATNKAQRAGRST